MKIWQWLTLYMADNYILLLEKAPNITVWLLQIKYNDTNGSKLNKQYLFCSLLSKHEIRTCNIYYIQFR